MAQFTGPRGATLCLGVDSEGGCGLPGLRPHCKKLAVSGFLESRSKQARDLDSSDCSKKLPFSGLGPFVSVIEII